MWDVWDVSWSSCSACDAERGNVSGAPCGPKGFSAHLCNLLAREAAPDVLLVGEDEQARTGEALLTVARQLFLLCNSCSILADLFEQQPCEFPPAVLHALAVARVDDPDDRVGRLKVVPPVGPQRSLAPNVPCRAQSRSAELDGSGHRATHRR